MSSFFFLVLQVSSSFAIRNKLFHTKDINLQVKKCLKKLRTSACIWLHKRLTIYKYVYKKLETEKQKNNRWFNELFQLLCQLFNDRKRKPDLFFLLLCKSASTLLLLLPLPLPPSPVSSLLTPRNSSARLSTGQPLRSVANPDDDDSSNTNQ